MSGRMMRIVVVTVALVAAACGSGGEVTVERADDGAADASPTPEPTDEPTPTPDDSAPDDDSASATGPITTISDARSGVLQIVATGTFADPAGGEQSNVPGSGTGFFIDPSGIAVTNNHVVTGAALLEVFIDGRPDPLNARILGVSECSDLAVIDVDGEGFPYFEWYEGEIDAGLGVFAAGYPLGDPEYTLLDGIVSKADAGGETNWASVDAVIEHSADTLPGNSGGPILTEDAQIVAVNYAGNDLGQSFAIGREEARPIIEQLATEVDVDSVGINGEAFLFEDGTSGIWVASVDSGSPASNAGVEPGDIIVRLENIAVGIDGTMSDYCDVLRSNSPDDVMSIEVYRSSTDEALEGELNGAPLEVVFSFSANLDEEVAADDTTGGPTYDSYVEVTDDSGTIVVSVPSAWSDVFGPAWVIDDVEVGPAVTASGDVQAWQETWSEPGVFVGASNSLPVGTPDELLDSITFEDDCTYDSRIDYDDGVYVGVIDLWLSCGNNESDFLNLAAVPPDGSFIVLVQIVAVTDADLDAADQILATFDVIGGL